MRKYSGFLMVAGTWLGFVALWLFLAYHYFSVDPALLVFVGLLNVVMVVCFFIWLRSFEVFPEWGEISKWKGFRRKSQKEILGETAQKALGQGDFNIAENLFRELLRDHPDDGEAHRGLAESLFGQSNRGVRKDAEKRTEALEQYQWVLRYYLGHQRPGEALTLYRRILGPYSAEEIGEKFKPLLSQAAEGLGTVAVHNRDDLLEYRRKLHAEFEGMEAAGKYPQAQAVSDEILKNEPLGDLEPGFLIRMGEVGLRAGNPKAAEPLFEEVAKRGDRGQTLRALEVLARFWLKTPKQPHLTHLYQGSAERFATLDESHEWVELGRKLKQ